MSKASPKFVILLYHGVSQAKHKGIENCSRKHLPAEEFARQMEYLATNYQVLPLSQLLLLKEIGSLPSRAVAITFDDGFENNYSVAYPIMMRYSIPATFFLATGFINTQRVFWVDKVEYLINESQHTFIKLKTLDSCYPLGSMEEKKYALQEIKRILKSVSGLVADVITELEDVSSVDPRYDYEDYRICTWEQVREMRQSGLYDFGGHTVNHEILSHLNRAGKEKEIFEAKETLERELSEQIPLFSYPEGQENHFDPETIEVLKSAGFSCSPSAIFGVNTLTTSNYYLRRNMVGFTASFEKCLEILNDICG
jgi:peptidoglycan/xylan/chitin deacetylase (PgdA/CDA1 family)